MQCTTFKKLIGLILKNVIVHSQRCQMFISKECPIQRNKRRHSENIPHSHRRPISWWN